MNGIRGCRNDLALRVYFIPESSIIELALKGALSGVIDILDINKDRYSIHGNLTISIYRATLTTTIAATTRGYVTINIPVIRSSVSAAGS